MEERKIKYTLTYVDSKEVYDHIETLKRRVSYLDERIELRNNSFDRRERGALRHCIWLLSLELDGGICLNTGSSISIDNGDVKKVNKNVIVRKKNEPTGV